MIKENKSQKEKEIERLDKKMNENLDRATILGGTGIGTAAASIGLVSVGASTEVLSSAAIDALVYPFVGGLVATGIAVIPLAIAAGYGIRKLIKKL